MDEHREGPARYYPVSGRVILHIDMNAFYCSVHEAEEPNRYKGKRTAVSGSIEQRKGIIVTCSYAARAKGIRTGMRVNEALRLCPDLLLIRPDFNLYRRYSRRFMRLIYEYTPIVEPISIDECFADITGSKQFGTPLQIAKQIQLRIQSELGLPCSIGIAPNKLLAKMASDMKKPMGITILRKRDVPSILWSKPCAYLFGIGQKTADKLKKMNIHTIGQLANADEQSLWKMFGSVGPQLKKAANGIDDSPVNPKRERAKSIGHTTTLPVNMTEKSDIRKVFLNLADQVTRRLRKIQCMAQTVQITIRKPNMKTYTRSFTLETPTDDTLVVFRYAMELFNRNWPEGKPVRLLGITLQQLVKKNENPIQLDLFEYTKKPKTELLTQTIDKLRDKFGEDSVLRAGMISEDPSSFIRDFRVRGTSLQKDELSIPYLPDKKKMTGNLE